MLPTPDYILDSVPEIRRLIEHNPWATIVAQTENGIVASHYPVILDEEYPEEIVLLGHVGRPDDVALELGTSEVLLIVQGPHGYVSASWYPEGAFAPTWNHLTAHLWGVPELLSEQDSFKVLATMVDKFEQHVDAPRSLAINPEMAKTLARGAAGFRIRITRWDARAKLSQDKPAAVVDNVISELSGEGFYRNPALAAEMRRYFSETER